MELIRADSAGLYFNEKSIFNPRLFAYVQTDSKGRFYLKTIKPGTYPDDKGSMVIPHKHFNISKVGYRNYNSEFIFTDDSLYYQQCNPESLPEAILKKDGSISEYEVVINLQQSL